MAEEESSVPCSIILDSKHRMFDSRRLQPKIRNLVDVKNGLIFAFDPIHRTILVTRASSFINQTSEKYQVYSPSNILYGDADLLRVNETTTKAAVRTDQSLFIMDLPHVYHCCLLPPTANNITKSRVWLVRSQCAEEVTFFDRALQVRWHPVQSCHLIVLFNDNFLRLIDVQTQTILNILSLGRHPTSNPLSTVIPLGEHAVDFAFVWQVTETVNDGTAEDQQIMLIRGNGQIFYAVITPEKALKGRPLTIDSGKSAFTSENWCIMVMPCYPPIVVIVSDEFIYHFVLFEDVNRKHLQLIEAIHKWESPAAECSGRGCTEYIMRDTASMSRYFVVSHAGILAVIIPTLDRFTDFWAGYVDKEAASVQESTKDLLTKNTSKMEMITSKDLGQSSLLHLIGFGMISGYRFTTHIITVLSTLETVTLSVENTFQFEPTVHTYSKSDHVPQDDIYHIWKGFQKDISSTLSLKEQYVRGDNYQLMMKQAAFFKEQVLQHNNIMAEHVEKSIHTLEVKLTRQEVEMKILKSEKDLLKTGAERIAELYEEINEYQNELLARFQRIALSITSPIMSLAEKKMSEDVNRFRKTTEYLVNEIIKVEHEIAFMCSKEHTNVQKKCLPHKQIYLTEPRRKILREELTKMNVQIATMKANVHRLNDIVKACGDISFN